MNRKQSFDNPAALRASQVRGLTTRPSFILTGLGICAFILAFVFIYAVQAQGQEVTGTRDATGDNPPDRPTNLQASAKYDSVSLTWTASTDQSVTRYAVLRRDRNNADVGVFEVIESNAGSGVSHTDGSVSPEGSYVYRVKAVSPTGVSQWSSYAKADTPAAPDPTPEPTPTPTVAPEPTPEPEPEHENLAPSGLIAALAEDGGVALSWTAPAQDAGAVTGYEILRAQGDGDLATLVADNGSAATDHTDATATEASATYAYQVIALRGEEKSQPSNPAEVGLPPARPTGLTTAATHEAVTMTWDDPGDDSITHYQVYRRETSEDAQGDFVLIESDTDSVEAAHTDDDVSPDTGYAYQVRAVNAHGAGRRSQHSQVTTPPDHADLAPTNLTARPLPGPPPAVELAWDAPAEDAASVTGYEILRAEGDGGLAVLVADTGSVATTYTDATATDEGESYAYRVKALREEETSQPSGRAVAIIPKVTVRPVEPRIAEEQNVETEVPANWGLTPSGMGVGDRFRLLFRTSGTRDATSTGIADYDTFVQNAAAAGHVDIQSYSTAFRVLGSTSSVDARGNTATAYTDDDKGVPIYWLDGGRVADDYEDFYDGSWSNANGGKDENGSDHTNPAVGFFPGTWTGSEADGTEAISSSNFSEALGESVVRIGRPLSSTQSTRAIAIGPVYGLSGVFVVADVEEVSWNWGLTPSGVGVGDRFRLLFRTSGTRDATSTGIADYDTFVQNAAAAGHVDIQSYSTAFRVLGSTSSVDARGNTATAYTDDDKGVPIYWLDGGRVADDYEDFYDGSWSNANGGKDENGSDHTNPAVGFFPGTWTGSEADGTEAISSSNFSEALGESVVRIGRPLSSTQSIHAISTGPFYGLSGLFIVADAAPVFKSTAAFSTDENQTVVGKVNATDSNTEDTVSYAMTGGADQAQFRIDTTSGTLTFATAPDHENPADSDMNNVYLVTVTATGGTGDRELTIEQAVTVTVNDVDEIPAVASVDVTSDPGVDDTYSLGETIQVTVTFNLAVTVTDTPRIRLRIGGGNQENFRWANYAGGSDTALRFTYMVQAGDMDDNGLSIEANELELNGGTIQGVDDNMAADLTYDSQGPQSGHKVDGSLTTGCPALPTDRLWSACLTVGAIATIVKGYQGSTSDGNLSPASLDFGGTSYMVTHLSDNDGFGGFTGVQINLQPALAIVDASGLTLHLGDDTSLSFADASSTITSGVSWYQWSLSAVLGWSTGDNIVVGIAQSNATPAFTSADTFQVDENETVVGTVRAADADTVDAVSYALTSGTDQAQFQIHAISGALSFATAPDYENPSDADLNNVYLVTVTATGGAGDRAATTQQAITVTVNDVDEPPSAPATPTVEAVSGSIDSLSVSWTAPDNGGKPDIASYDLQYRKGTTGDWTDGPQDVTDLTDTIDGLDADSAYQVRVRATNDEGDSVWSSAATGSTNALAGTDPAPAEFVSVCDRSASMKFSLVYQVFGITLTTDLDEACKRVTRDHLANIDSLTVWGPSSLIPRDLNGLVGLRSLYLARGSLDSLPTGIFGGLGNLERLNISYTDLDELDPDSFGDRADDLKTLVLWRNNITSLPAGVFDGLAALEELSIIEEGIQALPADLLDNNTKLKKLSMRIGSGWMQMESGFLSDLGELRELHLGGNALTGLPDNVFDNNRKLKRVLLYNNELASLLDGVFNNNAALEEVYLADNELTSLPDGIFDNTAQLKKVDLRNNDLATLPRDLFPHGVPDKLYLSGNPGHPFAFD